MITKWRKRFEVERNYWRPSETGCTTRLASATEKATLDAPFCHEYRRI